MCKLCILWGSLILENKVVLVLPAMLSSQLHARLDNSMQAKGVAGFSIQKLSAQDSLLQQHLHVVWLALEQLLFLFADSVSPIFPVIVFSHGLGGMRTCNSAIVCDLASHGYVVAAVEHRYVRGYWVGGWLNF